MRISIIGSSPRAARLQESWTLSAAVVLPSQGAHAVTLCGTGKEQIRNMRSLTRRGVPMLVDLPMGNSARDIEQAFAGADLARVICLPALWLRNALPLQLARDAVYRGTIGTVSSVEIFLPGDASLLGTGFHAADLAASLLGTFERVSAESTPEGRKLTLTTAYGAVCEAALGQWQPVLCRIKGSTGSIEVGWRNSFIYREGASPICIGEELSETECVYRMTTRFQAVLYGEDTPWISFDELMADLDILEAASRSLVQGDEFEVETLAA